jgi:hypothetical protein
MKKLISILIAALPFLFFSGCSQGEKTHEKAEKNIVALPAVQPIPHDPFVITDSSRIQTLEGGMQLYVVEEGSGPVPEPNANVIIHYHGMLMDGSVFDSSYSRGQKADFSLTNLIRGWQIGLTSVKSGSKLILIIPPELAYGPSARPNIPANSTLIFDIELFSSYIP